MARVFALASMVVMGLMLADLVSHPNGTKAITGGMTSLAKNTGNQLLGHTA
jgi:hypothetical protein